MIFGNYKDFKAMDNWYLTTRNYGDVINVPMSLYYHLLNPKLTTYALTYLKLRYLCQYSYGSFKTNDFKHFSRCLGIPVKTLKNHIEKLIELNWLKEKHKDFFQLRTFNTKSITKVIKLTSEQIFSVRNSMNLDRTRLVFENRIVNDSKFTISKIKDTNSLSQQEFRILLTEILIEIDSQKKLKRVKYYDAKRNRSKDLTSPTKWERDCTKNTRHIAIKFVTKHTNLSTGTISRYRNKSVLLNLASYENRRFKNTNSVIESYRQSNGVAYLNTYMDENETGIPVKRWGKFFTNRNGELTLNLTSYRRSMMSEFNFTGIIRGKKKNSGIDSFEEEFETNESIKSIPFYNETFNEKSEKLKTNSNEISNGFYNQFSDNQIKYFEKLKEYYSELELNDLEDSPEYLSQFSNKDFLIYQNNLFLTNELKEIKTNISKMKKTSENYYDLKSIDKEFFTPEHFNEIIKIVSNIVNIEMRHEKALGNRPSEKGLILKYLYSPGATIPDYVCKELDKIKIEKAPDFKVLKNIFSFIKESNYFNFESLYNLFYINTNIEDKSFLEGKEMASLNTLIKGLINKSESEILNFKISSFQNYVDKQFLLLDNINDYSKIEYLVLCFIKTLSEFKKEQIKTDSFRHSFLKKLYWNSETDFWN